MNKPNANQRLDDRALLPLSEKRRLQQQDNEEYARQLDGQIERARTTLRLDELVRGFEQRTGKRAIQHAPRLEKPEVPIVDGPPARLDPAAFEEERRALTDELIEIARRGF
jgi:hypothetical protein